MKLSIPERIASDLEVYVLDPAHADPLMGDEEEVQFLRGRAVIVAAWKATHAGAVLDLPEDRAKLLDVWTVFRDLANRDDAAPQSAKGYSRISLAILYKAEALKKAAP